VNSPGMGKPVGQGDVTGRVIVILQRHAPTLRAGQNCG
jgi:hypothetical protein